MISIRAAAVLFLAACSAERPRPTLGDDGWGPTLRTHPRPIAAPSKRPPAPRPRALPGKDRVRWQRADEIASLTQIGSRDRSEHLEGRYERTVLVDDGAQAYAHLTVATDLSPGALVVQRHYQPGDDQVVVYYVMERVQENWRFIVLDTELRVAAEALDLCARCHREAPFDGLFGPPAPPPPP